MSEDPVAELAASAFDLLADSLGFIYCGAVARESGTLRDASSGFSRLPLPDQEAIVEAVVAAVSAAAAPHGESRSGRIVEIAAPTPGGATISALCFPEAQTAVFAVPHFDADLPADRFRAAAAAILPLLERVEGLRAERQRLLQSQGLLAHVGELAHVGGWQHSLATGRLVWSDALYAIHGLDPRGEIALDSVLKLYPSPGREKLTNEFERAAAEGGGFEVTAPIRTPSGERRVVRTVGRTCTGGSGRTLYGIAQDVTVKLSGERRLWWATNHDPITTLPNRMLFEDRIAVAAQRARRDKRPFALVIIEVAARDDAGPTAPSPLSDRQMQEVAARLSAVSRESDTIARLSPTEFAILLNDVDSERTLDPALARLGGQITRMRSDEAGGASASMTAGVAYFPLHAEEPEGLIRAAEMSLARAQRQPGSPIVIFDHTIADDAAQRRESVIGRARKGLARGEFVPYYQPQVDIETGRVVGVEALVRWHTRDLILDAKDFANALDDQEIGSGVGRAMLDAVIEDVARLKRSTDWRFRVSVNASRTEVLRNDFLDTFLQRARSRNLKPTDFTIEITEDVIIGIDDQALQDKLSFLVSSGVEFSLDDFGTGYASLIHITSFPIKEIKIDKQFVFGIETNRRKRAIVRGMVQIARSLGLNVIAEGVETPEQEDVLREIGCRYAQGFLYSFPLPFDQFANLLEA